MRALSMPSPISLFYVLLFQSVVLLLQVPSEFWTQVSGFLEVPQKVQLFAAPLFGSLAATGVEYMTQLIQQLRQATKTPPLPPIYWFIKIGVGWIVGLFGGNVATGFINANPVNIAFWSGLAGHGAVALYLANQTKTLNDVKNDTKKLDSDA